MQDRKEGFADEDTLRVALERSPSGSAEFTFCPAPAPGSKVHLGNAAWLAFLAANEYSHLHYLAPALDALGFRDPPGSGFDWKGCTVDLRVLRGFEITHKAELKAASDKGKQAMLGYLARFAKLDHPEAWGACASEWYETSGYDGDHYPAAAFEKHLIQTAHPGFRLQFFSGGKFVLEGKAFTEGSTQVVFARHDTLPIVIISFRGTEPDKLSDLIVDGKAWKTKLSKHGYSEEWGSMHSGFRAAFDSVGAVLRNKAAELEGQDVGIWITGHSLGAALATVMATELLDQIDNGKKYDLRGVYTYGSPRVGNVAFQEQFDAAAKRAGVIVARFRNGDDAVTHIPGLMLEYQHVGRLAHLTEDGLSFPDKDPKYGGLGKIGDHDIVGWDAEGKPKSGYYRRILDALANHPAGDPLNTCAPP